MPARKPRETARVGHELFLSDFVAGIFGRVITGMVKHFSQGVSFRAHVLLSAIGFFLLCLIQGPGLTATDTKYDLWINPARFLEQALHGYTDVFTLGQVQNQAYGYLFPHGLYFLAAQWLFFWVPTWLVQRVWWTLVLVTGYLGVVALVRKMAVLGMLPAVGARGKSAGSSFGARFGAPKGEFSDFSDDASLGTLSGISASAPWVNVLAAFAGVVYVLSPRTITTLTAISSETWPGMLAPWILVGVLGAGVLGTGFSGRVLLLAPSVLAVTMLGGVNATASMFACVPAAVYLLVHRARLLVPWGLGALAVSAWWIGPLVLMGKYAAPFTDYIENASVTTAILYPVEILRGVTSWSVLADSERLAGRLLALDPIAVLITCTIAAVGVAGLSRLPKFLWWTLALGVAAMAAGHGTFGSQVVWFLDHGAGVALRNLHKADLLVRLPLALGAGFMFTAWCRGRSGFATSWRSLLPGDSGTPGPATIPWSRVGGTVAALLLLAATASAWTGRLLPQGAWEAQPAYVAATAEYLNAEGANTRTLIYPATPFARQSWGWTRDEPLQPLLTVPWATRDAIPLVNPEAIRGLDGTFDLLGMGDSGIPAQSVFAGAAAGGFGLIAVREDAGNPAAAKDLLALAKRASLPIKDFGEYHVIDARTLVPDTPQPVVSIAAGGEAIALASALATASGTSPLWEITSPDHAQVVTDTPLRQIRNFGGGRNAVTAPLSTADENTLQRNVVEDYPSAGSLLTVHTDGTSQTSSTSNTADTSSTADTNSTSGNSGNSVTNSASDSGETVGPWHLSARGAFTPDSSAYFAADGFPATAWSPRGTGALTLWREDAQELPSMNHYFAVTFGGAPGAVTVTCSASGSAGDSAPAEESDVRGAASVPALRTTGTTPGVRGSYQAVSEGFRIVAGGGSRATIAVPSDCLSKSRPLTFWVAPGVRINSITGQGLSTLVRVTAGPETQHILLQRVTSHEPVLARELVLTRGDTFRVTSAGAPRNCTVTIDGVVYGCNQVVPLAAGSHQVHSTSAWTLLSSTSAAPLGSAPDGPYLANTYRAMNEGLACFTEEGLVAPVPVDAGRAACPADADATPMLVFSGAGTYRAALAIGAGIALLVVAGALWALGRRGVLAAADARADMDLIRDAGAVHAARTGGVFGVVSTAVLVLLLALMGAGTSGLVAQVLIAAVAAAVYLVTRRVPLGGQVSLTLLLLAGLWLAHAPLGQVGYAGGSLLINLTCWASVAAAAPRPARGLLHQGEAEPGDRDGEPDRDGVDLPEAAGK